MAKKTTKTEELLARESAAVYGASVGLRSDDTENVIRRLKEGLPASSFDKLCKAMAIPSADLARLAGIAPRTLARRKKAGRLLSDESERVLRLGVLFDRAKDVFGDAEAARSWLKSPKRALSGSTPLDYADTEPGAREVENLLGRVEHGVFG